MCCCVTEVAEMMAREQSETTACGVEALVPFFDELAQRATAVNTTAVRMTATTGTSMLKKIALST